VTMRVKYNVTSRRRQNVNMLISNAAGKNALRAHFTLLQIFAFCYGVLSEDQFVGNWAWTCQECIGRRPKGGNSALAARRAEIPCFMYRPLNVHVGADRNYNERYRKTKEKYVTIHAFGESGFPFFVSMDDVRPYLKDGISASPFPRRRKEGNLNERKQDYKFLGPSAIAGCGWPGHGISALRAVSAEFPPFGR
jgi:hypothetical protein